MATLLQLLALTSVFITTIVAAYSLSPSRTRLEDHHRTDSSILAELGFRELAAAAATAWRIPTTIFAPPDSSILTCSSCSVPLLLREHTVPGLYTLHHLRSLDFGTKIETLAAGRCITITFAYHEGDENVFKLFVGGVEITRPELYNDGVVIVHGLEGPVSHLSPVSCNIERLSTVFVHPPPSMAEFSIMRLQMLNDAMLRLRISGFSVLALALRVKFSELLDLEVMTMFALDDASIMAGGLSYVGDFRLHVVPNMLLMAADLECLPAATVLPTLQSGQKLVVTTAGSGGRLGSLTINYVKLTSPDLIWNLNIAVHGLSLPFQRLNQTDEMNPPKTKVQIGKETIFGSIKFSHSLAVKALDPVQRLSPLGRYIIIKKLGSGHFGRTWIVRNNNGTNHFVLKKIEKKDYYFYLSGLRERHFGKVILKSILESGKAHIGRFVETFDHEDDFCVISFYEGISLSRLIYNQTRVDRTHHPLERKARSDWWTWMKQTDIGREAMKDIIFQLLKAVNFCHQNGITHRDLNPKNIILCFKKEDRSCSAFDPVTADAREIHLRIIDFGSAIDEFTVRKLYPPNGPSRAEQYSTYMPPEAIMDDSWLNGPTTSTSKYDMWTVGQTVMELIFGSPDVFTNTLKGGYAAVNDLITEVPNFVEEDFHYMLPILDRVLGMSEFCVAVPGFSNLSSSHCSDEAFSEYVKRRDPLKLGFADPLLLPLVRHLLAADPDQRPTAEEALTHSYFGATEEVLGLEEDRGGSWILVVVGLVFISASIFLCYWKILVPTLKKKQ